MRTCADDCKVEIYMFSHARHIHATHRFRCDDAWHVHTFKFFRFWRKVTTSTYERDEFSRHVPLAQLLVVQLIMLRQGAWPPELCWIAEWVSCRLQGQNAFHNHNSCFNRSRTEGLREYFWGLACRKMRFSSGGVSRLNVGKRKGKVKFALCKVCFLLLLLVCAGGRSPSRGLRGATAAAVQQQSLLALDMSPKIRSIAAVTLILRGSHHHISQV